MLQFGVQGSSKEPQTWIHLQPQGLALQLLPIRPKEIHVDHKETTGSALIKSNGILPQVHGSQMMQGRYPIVWACLTFCTSMTHSRICPHGPGARDFMHVLVQFQIDAIWTGKNSLPSQFDVMIVVRPTSQQNIGQGPPLRCETCSGTSAQGRKSQSTSNLRET